jgi:hypothetical protein
MTAVTELNISPAIIDKDVDTSYKKGSATVHAEVHGQGGLRGTLQEGQTVLRQDP